MSCGYILEGKDERPGPQVRDIGGIPCQARSSEGLVRLQGIRRYGQVHGDARIGRFKSLEGLA